MSSRCGELVATTCVGAKPGRRHTAFAGSIQPVGAGYTSFRGTPLGAVCVQCSLRRPRGSSSRAARRRPRVARRRITKASADPNIFAWIASGVASATATAWALVAQKTIDALPGAQNSDDTPKEPDRDSNASAADALKPASDGMVAVRRKKDDDAARFRRLMFDARDADGDDDGLAERLAARDADGPSRSNRGLPASGQARRLRGKTKEPQASLKNSAGGDSGKQQNRQGPLPGFFFLGRRSREKSTRNGKSRRVVGVSVTYGGLKQAQVVRLVDEAMRVDREEQLSTLLPYRLQRQLFSQLRAPDCEAARAKLHPKRVKQSSGLSSTVPISRDALRRVENMGPADTSTEILDRIQRDMESLGTKTDSGKRSKKPKKKGRTLDTSAGWFSFFGRGRSNGVASDCDESRKRDVTKMPPAAGGDMGISDTSSLRRSHGEAVEEVCETGSVATMRSPEASERSRESSPDLSARKLDGAREVSTSSSSSGVLDIPLGMVGDLLKAVWRLRGEEVQPSQGEPSTGSKSVVAYAAAMARDASTMEESDGITGGTAVSAFAAASALASSQRSELDAIEAAGLQASVTAARAISSVEDAEVFVDTVGVGALVAAARVLSGQARSSALTAMANIAIMLPKSRTDMLLVDGASLVHSISQILHSTDRFSPVSQMVGRNAALRRMEALVSGTHLLGSLALAGGCVGKEWRTRMATDEDLVATLKRLAGGAKNGEPEGAARAARRALGALGINIWTPRLPGQRGLRILSIDGGGTRAIMAFEMLKHLEHLTGARISDMFDVIGGTSTGAIVAASLGIAHKSVEEVEALYRRLIGKIFAKHPVNGPKMLLTRAYYDTKVLEASLKRECGTGVFIDSLAEEGMNKVFVVSSIMSRSPKELHVFRNYTYPLGHESRYDGTTEAQLWEALRASSAAPTFFSEILVNGELHADGAIVANNPTAIALHETKCMFPGIPIECVVSMGNGLSTAAVSSSGDDTTGSGRGGERSQSSGSTPSDEKTKVVGWGDVVGSIVASATSTETVHHALSDLFPRSKYFRFNPETISTDIDETRPDKLAQFVEEARRHIHDNSDRFAEAAQTLRPKTSRSVWSRFRDALAEEMSAISGVEDDVYLP